MDTSEKVRENRLRRMAERRGFKLVKSRRRDPQAIDYGTYELVDAELNVVAGGPMTLDGIEQQLFGFRGGFTRIEFGQRANAERGSYVTVKPGVVVDIAITGRLYIAQDDGSLKEMTREEIDEELAGIGTLAGDRAKIV